MLEVNGVLTNMNPCPSCGRPVPNWYKDHGLKCVMCTISRPDSKPLGNLFGFSVPKRGDR